jgi:hypothetical protein
MPGNKHISSRNNASKIVTSHEHGRQVHLARSGPQVDKNLEDAERRAKISEGRAVALQKKVTSLEATLRVVNESVATAREESDNLRDELKRRDEEIAATPDAPTIPERVDVVTVDDIERDGDRVKIRGCFDFSGVVADAAVITLPFVTLRDIVRQKVSAAKDAEAAPADVEAAEKPPEAESTDAANEEDHDGPEDPTEE